MKLTTIWTLPAMAFRERLRRTADLAAFNIARKLPWKVRYWVFIQVGGSAIPSGEVVTDQLFVDVLARVSKQHEAKR